MLFHKSCTLYFYKSVSYSLIPNSEKKLNQNRYRNDKVSRNMRHFWCAVEIAEIYSHTFLAKISWKRRFN